ncbi:MAG: hypothetical protein IKD69_09855 [Solobacterium sp.]|nr:hypothetical protein [Solobacterium sp.]
MAVKLLKALYIILAVFAAHEVCVILHEAGHLAGGLLCGYSFHSFRIGSLQLSRIDGRWHFSRVKVEGTSGQCVMVPPASDHPEDVPCLLYHAGGGLANVVTALFSLIGLLVSGNLYVRAFLFLTGSISTAQALLNLVPSMIQLPNDGYNMRCCKESREDRIAMYSILRRQAYPDRTPSEMPASLFSYSEEGKYSRVSKLLHGSFLLDQLRFREAEAFFADCARDDEAAFPYYRLEGACEQLFCLLVLGEKEKITDVYDDALQDYLEKTKKTDAAKRRVLYAFNLLYRHDEKAAEEEYAAAKRLIARMDSQGEARMEEKLLAIVKDKA